MALQEIATYPSNTTQSYPAGANSKVCIKDVDSGEVFRFSLVAPADHDARNGKLSILTSLGTSLAGKCVGNMITWQAPSRLRRFEVQSVIRQG